MMDSDKAVTIGAVAFPGSTLSFVRNLEV